MDNLDYLFNPGSIALIGASATPGKWGLFILHNLLKDGYKGRIYAIGRKGSSALGVNFYGSIDEIGEKIDLALIAVPFESVIKEVERCISRGVKVIYVITGGFAETGSPEGIEAQQKLKEMSIHYGVPIIGPNGQGIINTHINLCAQMFFTMPPEGHISLITQSGNIGVVLSNFSYMNEIGISKIVSTGNAACVDIHHFIDYLSRDLKTKVICVYVEGTKNGRALINSIKMVSPEKPVIIMKAGNTEAGVKAAASHSSALASNAKIFRDACRMAGGIVVDTLIEMWDTACILSSMPEIFGRKLGILTLGGGLGVITADIAESEGFEITPLSPVLKEKIDSLLPPRWSRQNPIDLAASEGPTTVVDILSLMAQSGEFDAIVFVGFGESGMARHIIETGKFGKISPFKEICEAMKAIEQNIQITAERIINEYKIPFIGIAEAALLSKEISESSILKHQKSGFPTFPTPERGIRALRHLVEYYEKRKISQREIHNEY